MYTRYIIGKVNVYGGQQASQTVDIYVYNECYNYSLSNITTVTSYTQTLYAYSNLTKNLSQDIFSIPSTWIPYCFNYSLKDTSYNAVNLPPYINDTFWPSIELGGRYRGEIGNVSQIVYHYNFVVTPYMDP